VELVVRLSLQDYVVFTDYQVFRMTARIFAPTPKEVVNGKRGISKAQAKAFGKFFKVSPELSYPPKNTPSIAEGLD
jgi:hypothetical protein